MGFSRREYWCWLPFPSPGDLPNPGTEPMSPALQIDSLPNELQGKPKASCEPSICHWLVNSGSWCWTGRPGMLRFMGSQRVGHNWATDLLWSDGGQPIPVLSASWVLEYSNILVLGLVNQGLKWSWWFPYVDSFHLQEYVRVGVGEGQQGKCPKGTAF